MTPALEGAVVSNSSRSVQRQSQWTSEEAESYQEPSGQGKRQSQLAQTLPTRVQDPQTGTFSSGQCFQYGQSPYGIHSPRAGKDEKDFSMKIIDEIEFINSSIDVELEPCSTEDYINSMKDIITRTRIGKTWIRNPMESKMVPKISREDKRPVLKCPKCGSTSHLANTCTKKTKVNEELQCAQEKEESDQDSSVSEDTQVEDYYIENITDFFEVTEVHTHFPHYGEDFYKLINIQDSRICKTKPARGKGYIY
ncbi:hypothetical protein O181_080960 [Austropuccinia psidii MF-1]|uniref:Uncharacterized protein n=1 Tax=Austropuccinia psidii MF-1 TaxID=1389203 RepID=A0A9Q3FI13_9BASI|nr:hypothetical protein [Austropuccinia psidii MF-1]